LRPQIVFLFRCIAEESTINLCTLTGDFQ